MTEKFRLFLGVEELNYSKCNLIFTNYNIVNNAEVSIEGNSGVSTASTIDIKKADGSTDFLSGKVEYIKKFTMWDMNIFTNGHELITTPIQQVYTNKTPEYIVQDIIDNNTVNLTYASSNVSGFTLDKPYVADDYAINILKDMMILLDWQIRIDINDNVYFEPRGNVNNGYVLTEGSNFQVTGWIEDKSQMINHVKIIGGFESYTEKETVTGVGTEVTLAHKPAGTLIAYTSDGGSKVDPADYEVDAENKTVTFDASQTNPYFEYSWNRPIVVENQDDVSVNTYGKYFKTIQAPWLNSFIDGRKYAQQILNKRSDPITTVKGYLPFLNFDIQAGETVRMLSTIRNEDENLYISKIKYNGKDGKTELELGENQFVLFDWQRGVQTRIQDLEKRYTNEDEKVFAKLIKNNLTATLTITQTFQYDNVQNTFYLSHKTLNRLLQVVNGSKYNFEADCSDNSNNGTWQGSDIAGSQYNQTGHRLGAADFNGSNNYVTALDAATLDLTTNFSIAICVKVASLPGAEKYILNKYDGTDGYAIRINSDNKVEMAYYNSTSESVITADTALTVDTWQHLVFVKSGTALTVYINGVSNATDTGDASAGTNSNALELGRYSSNYVTGALDELRVYGVALTSNEALALYSKYHVNRDMVLYWAFDNPRLGLNYSSKVTVT